MNRAVMTKARETRVPEPIEGPAVDAETKMRKALAELRRAGKALLNDLADRDEETIELRETVSELKREIGEMNLENAQLEDALEAVGYTTHELQEHTNTLARLHTKIKRGRIDDGLHDLEQLLSVLDGAWRTRA